MNPLLQALFEERGLMLRKAHLQALRRQAEARDAVRFRRCPTCTRLHVVAVVPVRCDGTGIFYFEAMLRHGPDNVLIVED
jgi:hypothetical protein